MTLWSRWGVTSFSGPCGREHTREDMPGVPAEFFRLDCPECEAELRGDNKPLVIEHSPGNPALGIQGHDRKVKQRTPGWGDTMATAPPTDYERETAEMTAPRKRGQYRIDALEKLGALRTSGMNIPPEAAYLTDGRMP